MKDYIDKLDENDLAFIFRADRQNVGDWFCSPYRYFPFRPANRFDICNPDIPLNNYRSFILGGGGLGAPFFDPYLQVLEGTSVENRIVWGCGVDIISERNSFLPDVQYELYGSYFENFSSVGLRVWSDHQKFKYVPCVSCMHPFFDKYRDVKPTKFAGFYSHYRVPLFGASGAGFCAATNYGENLEEKLSFLADCEYVITNTFHGAYWATLLGRKVIAMPFKSGMWSLKHKPVFTTPLTLTDDILDKCNEFPESLDESRILNVNFFKHLADRYPIT